MSLVVTASATQSGQPIYRTAEGAWSPELAAAAVHDEAEAAQRELEAARTQEAVACDPYVIEAIETEGARGPTLQPVALKERIRATGPTVAIL